MLEVDGGRVTGGENATFFFIVQDLQGLHIYAFHKRKGERKRVLGYSHLFCEIPRIE